MRIAFITPYLSTLGGGEKYLLDIARACHTAGYQTELFWNNSHIKEQLLNRFGKQYEFITVNTAWHTLNPLQRIFETKKYDAIFYHPDGSYFFSRARKNFALLQVPDARLIPHPSLINKLKLTCWTPVFNSQFTKRFLSQFLNARSSFILYPTVSDELFDVPLQKQNIILSVGRFFSHLHSKKQEVLIQTFLKTQQNHGIFKKYRLILAGNLKKEDELYYNRLKKLAKNSHAIEFKTNIGHDELTRLYSAARFYWHATGYGEDEKKHPEKMEHFGISIVEAMAVGCIALCYKGGGPKEIITHNKTGFLYKTRGELIDFTKKLLKKPSLMKQFSQAAQHRAHKKFGFTTFSRQVQNLLMLQ